MDTIRDCTISPMTRFIKDVRHNCETGDFDAYVIAGDEAIYLGSRDTSWDAAALCDAYVYEQLMQQPQLEAALDTLPAPFTSTSASPARSSALQNCRRFSIPPCAWIYARTTRCRFG